MDEVTPIESRSRRQVKKRRERRTGPDRRRNEEARKVFEMKLGGKLPSEIARELGIPDVQVLRMLTELFSFDASFLADQDRKLALGLELMRLEALQSAIWEQAMMGDPKSVDSVVKIIQTRCKITGMEQADPVVNKNLVLVMGEKEDDYIAALKATQND